MAGLPEYRAPSSGPELSLMRPTLVPLDLCCGQESFQVCVSVGEPRCVIRGIIGSLAFKGHHLRLSPGVEMVDTVPSING